MFIWLVNLLTASSLNHREQFARSVVCVDERAIHSIRSRSNELVGEGECNGMSGYYWHQLLADDGRGGRK